MSKALEHWKRLHAFRDKMTGGYWSAETYRLIVLLVGVGCLVGGFVWGWCLAALAYS